MSEALTLYVDGQEWPAVQPTLELILFSSAPRSDLVPGLLSLYGIYARRYEEGFDWYKTNVMKAARGVDGSGFDQLETMLTGKGSRSQFLGLEQHSGPDPHRYGLPAFEFFSEEEASDPSDPIHHTYVRLCMPAAEAGDADEVFSLACALAAEVPFDSGYCGYSFYWNTEDSRTEHELAKVNRGWLTRYPGLAYGDPLTFLDFVDQGILGVSWITFLGRGPLDKLGGEEALAGKLSGAIAVRRLANDRGVAIRAGVRPALGDRNRNDGLPAYHEVGRAVSPLRLSEEWVENMDVVGMTTEQVVEWYERFFPDAE